jgi:adenylylsulfate kinase-like enzyme
MAKPFAHAGVLVITSFISPYREERDSARRIHNEAGHSFAEIFIDTPLEVCEARDPKGLCATARRGGLKGFTGIDDPYEPPFAPELVCETANYSPPEIVSQIMDFLVQAGFLSKDFYPRSSDRTPSMVRK